MTGQKEKLERIGNLVPHPLGSGKNTMVSPWLAHARLFSSTASRWLVAGQTSGGENYEAMPPVTTPMANTKDVPDNHTDGHWHPTPAYYVNGRHGLLPQLPRLSITLSKSDYIYITPI